MKLKDLKELPNRRWNEATQYDSILILAGIKLPNRRDVSMVVIGCNANGDPEEIAAICEEILWEIPLDHPYKLQTNMPLSGVMRFSCLRSYIEVGTSQSTTFIRLYLK